jgi:hypothetical protein
MTRSTIPYRRLWFLVATMFCVSNLVAQTGNIYGIVVDSLTKQRIPFANVSIIGTQRGAASNNVGFYYIPKLAPGTYEIEARVMGYISLRKKVSLNSDQGLEVNFEIVPTEIEVQEVLVNAPRKRLELEMSTSVHVVQKQELKAVPVAAQQDLLQSLKILPGIVSTSDVSSRFYVRGGAGDQNLFLFDGIRIYYPFHALGIFSTFNPNVVDNVEVYTGAFPPGLGGRLSSVVNVFTRDGRADKLQGSANVNFMSSEIELEGPFIGGSSLLVDARKSISSQTFSKIVGQTIPISFYDATVKLSTQPGGIRKFDATFITSGDELRSSSPDEPDYSWRNTGFAINGSTLPGEQLFLQWLVFGSIYSADRDAKDSKVITPASTSVKHYGLRTSATLYTSPEDLYYFGFEFGVPSLDYSYVNALGVPQQLTSTFIEPLAWVRYMAKYGGLEIDGGLHVEVGSLFSSGNFSQEVQPRLNLSYPVIGTWRAKLSFGRFSQRMLTVGNEDDVISIFDAWIQVPENVPPERADHFVAGLSGNLTEQTSLNIEAYIKNYTSLVVFNRDKVDVTDPDYVQGTGKSSGIEMMVRSKIDWIDLYLAYSLSWARVDNEGLNYYPRYDRRHHVNLMAIAHPAKGLSMALRWEYGSGFPFSQTVGYFDQLTLGGALPGQFELENGTPYLMLGAKNAARLPSYHRLDANFSYNLTLLGFDVSVGLDILNVYDNKNFFYFDRKIGQSINMLPFYPSASITVKY